MMQRVHRESLVCDRRSELNGYDVSLNEEAQSIKIYEVEADTGRRSLILHLGIDTTRRQVKLSTAAWKAKREKELREGADRVRQGIKALLEIEAA
ncbi:MULTISPECIES: hypothetical protein [Methylobacterium]|jgi:hypothetical protein|uniref:Uncharacterized protein n=1 Tax=Methylobacterium aquaticum TaxID=270351 RepID=A0A0C6FGB6_9HYPH|nr:MULTISPECIES: hypothetical protein [Methylobacterium]NGM37127.1 hypothetical protein [Methylobacterium sp. DB0501]BAQ47598.1 hypothetical protein Maq22A_c23170 [Methylobacterium aquaticum]